MNHSRPTDALLWRVRLASVPNVAPIVSLQDGPPLSRIAWSSSASLLYIYASLTERAWFDTALAASGAASLFVNQQPVSNALACRLELCGDLSGASDGEVPDAHYVVETDADTGWLDEIQQWYQDEHLPGLAGVPGCVAARRYLNHDDQRSSLACYDLICPKVLESPPWMSVRATDWSSRVRAHFRDTTRTMFQIIQLPISIEGDIP